MKKFLIFIASSCLIYGEGIASCISLREIARKGILAKNQGSEVVKLIDSKDYKLRRCAVRTLGFIGYEKSIEKLMELVNDPSDVVINRTAVESLGRLKAYEALDILFATSNTHWHPSVKSAAKTAIEKISNKADYERKFHRNNFPLEYFNFQKFDMEVDRRHDLPTVKPLVVEDYSLQRFFEKGGELDKETQKFFTDLGIMIQPRSYNCFGVKTSSGWLIGSDNLKGDKGILAFKPDQSTGYIIARDYFTSIHKLGEKYICTAGNTRPASSYGLIYELQFSNNKWKAEFWRGLPSSPGASGKLESGEIIISTYLGGIVVVSENGTLRMADSSEIVEQKK